MNDKEIQHAITEQINQQLQGFPIENSCVLETLLSNTPMGDILNPSGLPESEMPAIVAECILTPHGGKTSRRTRSVCHLFIVIDCRNNVNRLYYEGTNGDISSLNDPRQLCMKNSILYSEDAAKTILNEWKRALEYGYDSYLMI